MDKVVFHSDALVVVDCINSISCNASHEPITEDCRVLLRVFSFRSVIYHPRSSNSDAHNVVSLGKLHGSRTWLGGFPMGSPVFPTISGLLL